MDDFIAFLFMSLVVWVPAVALILWAFTFITDVSFNLVFVGIVSGVLSILSAIVLYKLDEY